MPIFFIFKKHNASKKSRVELSPCLRTLISRRLTEGHSLRSITSWFDVSISTVRRIQLELRSGRFHPDRKRTILSEKTRHFFVATQKYHKEAEISGKNALYLTPIRKTSALGRPPIIGVGSKVGAVIRFIIQQIPDIYLFEVQSVLIDVFEQKFSLAVIRNYIISRGLRVAKGQRVVPQSDPKIRKIWSFGLARACSSLDQLIFIDETSHGRWTGYRHKGRSPKGTPVYLKYSYSNSKSRCLLGAFDTSGLFSYSISLKTPNSLTFERFLRICVVPHLRPYPQRHSIVIIDNAPTHNIENIKKIVSSTGSILICLPAYSPDLNPIEMYFSAYKSYWRRNRHLKITPDNIKQAVHFLNRSNDWQRTIQHVYKETRNGIVVQLPKIREC